MTGLLLVGVVVLVIALYLAERFLKARAQARRRQEMNDRLAAATARVDEQQAQKRAKEKASAALTNVMPAINRPPLSLPGMETHGPARSKPSRGRPGTGEHKTARPARRGGRTGDHPVRASERHGA
jgi:type II secretory pathway pseudopilin PulG